MIRLENLSKSFGGKPALHELSLKISRGEIFGLLGHNGAGKSTAFGIMLGQVQPSSGEAFIDGISVQRDRARALAGVGAIFEAPGFYDYMSGWKNLEIFTSYTARLSRKEIAGVVELVGLSDRIRDPVRTYSHGMRQRLALAQALLPTPKVVLLDEPTEGLDPEGIHEIRNLVQRLNKERGLTVLFSSHLLSEVEQLCDRVAIINQGRMIFQGPWSDLEGKNLRYRIEVNDPAHAEIVAAKTQVRVISDCVYEVQEGNDVSDFIAALVWGGIKVRLVQRERANLESLYLKTVVPGKPAAPSGSTADLLPKAAAAAEAGSSKS